MMTTRHRCEVCLDDDEAQVCFYNDDEVQV